MDIKLYDDLIRKLENTKFKKLPQDATTGFEFEEWLRKNSMKSNCNCFISKTPSTDDAYMQKEKEKRYEY